MNCKVWKWMLIVVAVATLLMSPLSGLADSHADMASTPPETSAAQAYEAQAYGIIEGYVTDGDGTGLYEAYVNAYGPGSVQTSTDNEGWYSIAGLVGGPYTVTAYPPYGSGLVLYCATAEVVGGETTALDFVLPAGGEIAGRVTDNYGAGVYNAYVFAYGEGFGSGETSTDNEGYYSVVGLMSDSYDVWVSPPSGANLLQGVTTVQVTQGDTTGPLNFVLPAGGIIAGRVTDEHGAGVYNAGVEANGPGSGWASTDNQGYYSIVALQPSAGYTVTASPPDEADLLQSTATGVAVEAVTTTTVNFVLLAPVQGTIAGRVTDNYGVAVSGLQVYASGPVWRQDYTDSSGNYSIDGLEIGSYTVTAYPSTAVNLVSSSATGVVVEADTTTTQDFVLLAGGIITGRVTDGNDAPVYLAYVYAYSPANRATYTDNQGYYSIVGLETGSYTVKASYSGGNLLPSTATPAVIQGDTTTQNFVLPWGGVISGRVTDEDGTGLYFALVSAYGSQYQYEYDYTDADGYYSIVGLKTGSFNVTAQPPSGPSGVNLLSVSTTDAVVEGSTTTQEFVLPWGGILQGWVTDGDGAGVYNAGIHASGSVTGGAAYTDEDGYYSIVGLRSDNYAITISPASWSNLLSDTDTAEVFEGDTTTLSLVLPWGGIIEGWVTDEDGEGVYNAYIYAEGTASYGSANTDSDGYYCIRGLESDDYTVTADPDGEIWLLSVSITDVSVAEGDTTALDLELPWGGIIDGQVTDGKAGVPYAYIEAYGPQDQGYAYANASGSYWLVGLQSDNYTVTATPYYQVNLLPGEAYEEVTQGEVTTIDFILQPPDTTPPPAPTLLSPASWKRINYSYALDWSDVSDPSGVTYELQIDDSPDFSSPLWEGNVGGDSTCTLDASYGLPDGGWYYWRVRAWDGAGNPSAWTSRGAFKLDTTAPDRPELVSPADGATTGKTPTLDWSDVTDVSTVHYQMQVDNDADFSSPVINKTWVSSSQYTVYSWQALPAGTYYWRVIAIDGAGNDSGWNSWSFVVDATPPDAPTLQSPANWKKINYSWPLDWSDASDDSGVNYQLQIDDSSNFSSPLLVDYTAIGTSTFTLSAEDGLADGGWYYWRVRAVDGVGNASAWSSRGAFKLDTTAPDLPELVSPADGATTTKTPTLDWSDVTDISTVHYQLQVDNDSDFSSPVIYKTWVSVSEYTVAAWQALPAGTYYWRVIAIDGAGNDSGWTSGWSFTVGIT